jgi:hypothetical protein
VPDARTWQVGQPVDLVPRAFALYRDDKILRRS